MLTLSLCIVGLAINLGVWHWALRGWLEHRYELIVASITIDLALTAILYAWTQDYLLRKQVEKLNRIAGFVSTQRTGSFASHVARVAKAADDAVGSLDIMIDCVDYGSFFAPEEHHKAHEAICTAASQRKVKVRLLVCGPPQALTGTSGLSVEKYVDEFDALGPFVSRYLHFIRDQPGFVGWMCEVARPGSPDFMKLADWLARWESRTLASWSALLGECCKVCSGAKDLTKAQADKPVFRMLLQARQYWFVDQFRRANVDVAYASGKELLYLWIRDARVAMRGQALFAFPNTSGRDEQSRYQTEDQGFLYTFQGIFDQKWWECPRGERALWART